MVAIPGGRAAYPPRDRRDREGAGRQEEVRFALHERAASGRRSCNLFEPSPYLFFSVHLDGCASTMTSRSVSRPCSIAPLSAIKAAGSEGLRRQRERHDSLTGNPAAERRGFPRLLQGARRRRVDLAGLRIRARAGPGTLPQSEKDKELFRKVFSMAR